MHSKERALHAGVSQTLALFRSEYYIPNGCSLVSSIIRRCLKCRKYKDAPYKLPPMEQLPLERVTESHVFPYAGVDFFRSPSGQGWYESAQRLRGHFRVYGYKGHPFRVARRYARSAISACIDSICREKRKTHSNFQRKRPTSSNVEEIY